jgi:mono/diheme cytochrome c family protein
VDAGPTVLYISCMSPAGIRGVVVFLAAIAFAIATPFAVGSVSRRGDSNPGDPAKGKVLFKQFCASCHIMKAAEGSKGTVGPNLDTDKVTYTQTVAAIIQGVGGIQAEYLLRALTFKQIYDVSKFVVTQRSV